MLKLFACSNSEKLATWIPICLAAVAVANASAAERPTRPVDGIMDNSFLVEEAYNQEAGVVQHILTAAYGLNRTAGPDDEAWNLAFTQEWPVFSQRHQFSYTIPYSLTRSGGAGDNGIGDVLLNYRFQALFDEKSLLAFAPRFSLVLPTGDEQRGFGAGTLGYQANLPFSTAIGDDWFVHLNAGATFLPEAGPAPERDLWHYNLGASLIYAATSDFHLMVELLGVWNNVPSAGSSVRHEFAAVVSPGVRKAFNFANDSQFVLGLAAPVGLTGSAPDFGAFLYLSFEHNFQKAK